MLHGSNSPDTQHMDGSKSRKFIKDMLHLQRKETNFFIPSSPSSRSNIISSGPPNKSQRVNMHKHRMNGKPPLISIFGRVKHLDTYDIIVFKSSIRQHPAAPGVTLKDPAAFL